jgi:hypothetical protein
LTAARRSFGENGLLSFTASSNSPKLGGVTFLVDLGRADDHGRCAHHPASLIHVHECAAGYHFTCFMHNRARMIVASFLIKDLMIDWRVGEAWFWDTLFDADLANNAASWQWVAGSGVDAAPYFRVFNPVTQGKQYDQSGSYVRKWVPELAALPDALIHKPWAASAGILRHAGVELGVTYPHRIVDHTVARERALATFKNLPKHNADPS